MNNKTIIFDFDGTLVNTMQLSIDVYNYFSPYFRIKRIKENQIDYLRNIKPKQILKELEISSWKLPFLLFFIKYKITKQIDEVQFYDKMKEVIHYLKRNGYSIGILTNNSKKTVNRFLEREDMVDCFDFIYTSKSLFQKDKAFKILMKEQFLTESNIIYIADEVKDLMVCKKMNIKVMSVCWGYSSKSSLKKNKPDFLVEKPQDIISMLYNLK